MKSRTNLILTALVIVLLAAAGGFYFFIHQSPAGEIAPGLNAAFDSSSLTSGSTNPEITGSCTNIPGALAITIVDGKTTLPQNYLPSYPNSAVYTQYTDHGGQLDASCSSDKGTFSTHYDNPKLKSGIYTIGLYTYRTVYTNQRYQGDAGITLLTSATFVVK